jgi:hypothetical protein
VRACFGFLVFWQPLHFAAKTRALDTRQAGTCILLLASSSPSSSSPARTPQVVSSSSSSASPPHCLDQVPCGNEKGHPTISSSTSPKLRTTRTLTPREMAERSAYSSLETSAMFFRPCTEDDIPTVAEIEANSYPPDEVWALYKTNRLINPSTSILVSSLCFHMAQLVPLRRGGVAREPRVPASQRQGVLPRGDPSGHVTGRGWHSLGVCQIGCTDHAGRHHQLLF